MYPLYALLFADAGLSDAQISALFAIWSAVALLAEVPTGMLADRVPRRAALAAAGAVQATGFALWLLTPGFPGFAAGFALWAVGGALTSGALEALLFDALTALGAPGQFPRLLGRVTSAGLLAQLPAAALATVLVGAGGYALAGWASVVVCLAAAALAACLPEPRPAPPVANGAPAPPGDVASDGAPGPVGQEAPAPSGFLADLRATAALPGAAGCALAVALVTALDAVEEYAGLLAQDWGVPSAAVPLALVAVPLAGAAGAGLAGVCTRHRGRSLVLPLAGAAASLAGAALLARPAGVLAVAAFYGLCQLVQVALGARLQERIPGGRRATVTSVAGVGAEVASLAVFAAWAQGGALAVSALVAAVAAALPWLLRAPGSGRRPVRDGVTRRCPWSRRAGRRRRSPPAPGPRR
ncbi:MFS transporter [Georgenia ruanii]|uniref:MFS transporter n=1 Tax=Georgenia ruanii TaxID=348442 RepID=UPI001D0026C4|nr:MFS transporter [Georgenia ruanii]